MDGKRTLTRYSPVDGRELRTFDAVDGVDVPRAVGKARMAFSSWSRMSVKKRLTYFAALKKVLLDRMDHVTGRISLDTGKPRMDSLATELFPTLGLIDHILAETGGAVATKKVKTPLYLWGKRSYIRYEPLGIIAVISPFNFPFQLAVNPCLLALATGNTVVLKPSSATPIVADLIREMFGEAGFPPGVFTVLLGSGEVGDALIGADIDKVFFTGSVEVGKSIMAKCASRLVPVELELGGSDPMIVCDDAPMPRAIRGALWGAFENAGQSCISAERTFVHEDIYDRFVGLLRKEVRRIRTGPPSSDTSDVGPLITTAQYKKVVRTMERARAENCRVLHGGIVGESGNFVHPTIVEAGDKNISLMREETFGPVLVLKRFSSDREAVKLANDSRYGLSASVWSEDLPRARRIAARLRTGSVCINDIMVSISNPYLPFGGIKDSGIGRYYGLEGFHTFCNIKSVIVDPGTRATEAQWFPYRGKYDVLKRTTKAFFGSTSPKRYIDILLLRSKLEQMSKR